MPPLFHVYLHASLVDRFDSVHKIWVFIFCSQNWVTSDLLIICNVVFITFCLMDIFIMIQIRCTIVVNYTRGVLEIFLSLMAYMYIEFFLESSITFWFLSSSKVIFICMTSILSTLIVSPRFPKFFNYFHARGRFSLNFLLAIFVCYMAIPFKEKLPLGSFSLWGGTEDFSKKKSTKYDNSRRKNWIKM